MRLLNVSFGEGNTKVDWSPEDPLIIGAVYNVIRSEGITDVVANPLVPFTSAFTVTGFALIRPEEGNQRV